MNNILKNSTFYSPSQLYNLLLKSISFRVENIQCYCYDPISDFSRNRIFTPFNLINLILSFENHSTSNELCRFFALDNLNAPSASALSQARRKLNPDIFRAINSSFINSIDNLSTFKGYYILAQDGSAVNIPFLNDDTAVYIANQKPYCQFHLNALYDCINNIFWDFSIDHYNKKREIDSLINILNQSNYPTNSIIIADRGYESYNLIAHFLEKNQKFIIRVKDINTKTGILTTLTLPDNEFDITITRNLTNLQTNKLKGNNEYVFVPSTSRFDFLDACNRKYTMTFRIVRFKLDDNHYETIITNLNDDFELKDFKYLYHQRWDIETAFRDLKYSTGMIYFHSKNRQLIKQEINASILLYNFTSQIGRNIKIHKDRKKGKYKLKISYSQTLTNIKMYLKKLIDEQVLVENIKKFLILIRPERQFKRTPKPKSAIPLNHRIS